MKKGKNNKLMLGVGVGVAVIATFLYIVGKSVGQPEALPKVEAIAVTKGDVAQELDASGTVESQRKKSFFSPVNATISQMTASAGDMVKKGEKLVTFRLEDLEKENQKAELNRLSDQYDRQNTMNKSAEAADKKAEAQSNVEKLEASVAEWKQYVADLKDYMAQVSDSAREEASQQAADAQAALEQERAQLTAQYEQEMQVYEQETLPAYETQVQEALQAKNKALGAYNKADMEYQIAFETWSTEQTQENQVLVTEKEAVRSQAQIAWETAEAAYAELEANPPVQPEMPKLPQDGAWENITENGEGSVDTAKLQSELEEASTTLAELQAELSAEKAVAEADAGTLTPEELAKMDVTSNLAELESKSLEELIAEGRKGIEAEFNGIISDVAVTEGAAVTQGLQMFTLQSTEEVCVEIHISKYDFDKISVGQKAEIALGGQTYQGTVSKVSRIAEKNEQGASMIGAQVKIDNPDDNLFLGVDAKVTIHAAQAKDVLTVPTSAVNIGKDGSFCYVVEEGVIVKKPVVTGIASDTMTEIVEGLQEKDLVVLDMGANEEGDKVEVMA